MEFSIKLLADGFLFGFTYFGRGDNVIDEEADWIELNIYLGIAQLSWRWW